MIPFKLNISDLIDIPTSSEIDDLGKRANNALASRLYENWIEESSELRSSKRLYQNAIQLSSGGVVSISGELPIAIEEGMSAFDMKMGFAKSSKAKRTEDGGWYLVIPFQLSTRDTGNVAKSNILPRSITDTLRKKAKSGSSIQRIDKTDVPLNLQDKKTTRRQVKIEKKTFDAYVSKSGMYDGVTRKGNASRGSYVKFRTASSNSPNSWIHTGIRARKYGEKAYEKTLREAAEIVDRIVMDYL